VAAVTRSASAGNTTSWFLDESTILDELRRIRNTRSAPPTIPGYDDLHELHRGGQGVVYSAVQRSTRRRVAIKVLVDGAFASDAARVRFEREIDLVASLNHANIVRIYDSGVSQPPDAHAYFVMEYIEGLPLNEFIVQAKRDLRTVLPIFARICRAVSDAHQHGVIHRDLKPSNIRIDKHGEPHVLDFGLAKVAPTNQPDRTHTDVVSIAGQFLGSLPWASPEQAQGDTVALDVRSDVYSIGVMLYHALTGTFPYDVDAGLRNVLDAIVNDDPVRPSTVDRTINDELETIVLTCLAKDPERRYQSAAELALDLERYLKGEPIQAKRDSAWYTMRKRLRRYRVLGTLAALLAISLSAGIAATLWQAQLAAQERDTATRRFEDVRSLARYVLYDLHDQIVNLAGSRPAREALITTALTYLEDLAKEAGDDHELIAELATGYLRVGNLQGRPNVPNLGDTAGALASYEKALGLAQHLEQQDADSLQASALLIQLHQAIGEVQAVRGNIDGALAHLNTALDRAQQDADAAPDNIDAALLLANVDIKLGDTLGHPGFANAGQTLDAVDAYDNAERRLAVLLDQFPTHSQVRHNVAMVNERQGALLEVHGKPAEALHRYQRALEFREALVKEKPGNDTLLRDLAISHEKIGGAYLTLGLLADAEESFAHAAAVFDNLLEADPDNASALMSSALIHERIGHLKENLGDAEGAVSSAQAALELFLGLAHRDPGNEQAQLMAAVSRINLGDVLGHPYFTNVGRIDDSIKQFELAHESFAALHDADPDHLRRTRFYALACERLGTMMLAIQQPDDARTYFEESMSLRAALAKKHPEHTDVQRDLGVAHEQFGKVFEHEHRYSAAIECYKRALLVYTRLAAAHPDTPQLARDIEVAHEHMERCSAAIASPE